MLTLHDKDRTRRITTALSGAVALAMVAGAAAPLHAQTQDQRERAMQNPGDWEWEADEGYHKEEWYDPSDWFDGERSVDFEHDWDDFGYDDDADGYGYGADDDWVTGSDWYDGYWDGYHDGYNDDQYGMDNSPNLGSRYGDSYTSGYSDGYYDQDRGYSYDPYYYVYTVEYDNARTSERERMNDRDRKRGDRAMDRDANGEQPRSNGRDKAVQQQREKEIRRVRGEVERVEFLRGTGSETGTDLIARVTFKEDGKKRVVNLGPKMTKDNVPFEKGDRVTLRGVREQHQDRQVLTVHRMNVEGQTVRLAAAPDQPRDGQTARADRKIMEGTIRSVSKVDADSERYTLLRIQLDNGKSGVIAVSDRWAEDMDAERGDKIVIIGDQRTIEGRTVIRPHRIDVNGERLSMR